MGRKIKCPYCGKKVDDSFNYCPHCGNPLKKISTEEVLEEFEKIIDREMEKLESIFGFPIPRIKLAPLMRKEEKNVEKKKIRKKYKKVEEPEMEIEESENEKIFTVILPGVKREEDIELKELEESLELRAFGRNKLYFKIIPVRPRNVIGKSFEKERLSIFALK